MTLVIQTAAAAGVGTGVIKPQQAFDDLKSIANFDDGLVAGPPDILQSLTYMRTDGGVPPARLDELINTDFDVVPPPAPDIIVLAVAGDFHLQDGSSITDHGGTMVLPPAGSDLPGADLNGTASCVVVYDTSDNNGLGYCVARANDTGDPPVLDLHMPTPVLLYHSLSRAFRIVTADMQDTTEKVCEEASPESQAGIKDENDMRTQLAAQLGTAVELRAPKNICVATCQSGDGGGESGGSGEGSSDEDEGSCCMGGWVWPEQDPDWYDWDEASGQLRTLRDQFLRRNEIGHAFFDSLHYAYYGFSPQVVALMATDTELRSNVLHGFVRPVIRVLQLARDHVIGAVDGAELGQAFLAQVGDGDDARLSLAMLDRAEAILENRDDGPALTPAQRSVADLLLKRAISDEHVSWALIEPGRAYHGCLRVWSRGASAEEIGGYVEDFLTQWCGRLPVADRWASMNSEAVAAALDLLDSSLLRKPAPRRIFYGRLMDRYGEVPAVRDVVRSRTEGLR